MKLCSIASGSSGNCIYAGSDTTNILVDAGISGKRIEAGLNQIQLTAGDCQGILVTHEHSDHIKGIGVLARKHHIPIYTTRGTIEGIKATSSVGAIPEELFVEIQADMPFTIGDLHIHPFAISHDAVEPVAYRIEHGGHAAAVATDMGIYDDYIVGNLKNLDAVLLEANHDIHMLQVGSYPYYLKRRILSEHGHLSNESAGKLLCEILHDNMKAIFLGHLSKENNFPELAYETVKLEMMLGDCQYRAEDFRIQVAKREDPSELIYI